MIAGFGVEELFVAGLIIVLFTLSSAAIPFISLAIWRSASNYPRKVWWQNLLAWSAKLCAVFSGLSAAVSLLAVIYLFSMFVYTAIAHV